MFDATNIRCVLLFHSGRAWLCPHKSLAYFDAGVAAALDKYNAESHWIIDINKISADKKSVHAKVIEYGTNTRNFEAQQLKSGSLFAKVNKIEFSNLDTIEMYKSLGPQEGYTPKTVAFELVPEQENEFDKYKKTGKTVYINEKFNIAIKECRFALGCVLFRKKFKQYDKILELKILNYDIREEFDAVKNYFIKALGTKQITVNAQLKIIDDEIRFSQCTSLEIERINKELIESVKFEFVQQTLKKKPELDKGIYTMDEFFETYEGNDFKANTFFKDENDFFENILQISQTKHYRNLRFLSSIHAHRIMKLRFVLKPFGFIFLHEGERKYHVIWETLDTEEATYVWHVYKDMAMLKQVLRKIEDIINVVKVQGKTAYINTSNDDYQRIYHDYSDLIDGFVRWKFELENILT